MRLAASRRATARRTEVGSNGLSVLGRRPTSAFGCGTSRTVAASRVGSRGAEGLLPTPIAQIASCGLVRT